MEEQAGKKYDSIFCIIHFNERLAGQDKQRCFGVISVPTII